MVKDSENAPNACIATEAPRLARQPREAPPPTLRSRAGSQGGQNEAVLVVRVSSTGHARNQYWLLPSTSTGSISEQYWFANHPAELPPFPL